MTIRGRKKDSLYRGNNTDEGGDIGSHRICNLMTWFKIKRETREAAADCDHDPPQGLI